MRIYLAGPMSGHQSGNVPAFDAAAADLRERGYEVLSPAELDSPEIHEALLHSDDGRVDAVTWGDCLARDVRLISDGGIQAVVVLEDWQTSRGAVLETFVARLNGLPIYHYGHKDPLRSVATPGLVRAHSFPPTPTSLKVTA